MNKTKKFLSLILVLIMCFSVVPMTDLGMEASATSKTQAEALAWVRSQNGKSLDVDGYPASQPYQCVDFIAKYYEYLGVSRSTGNGCDYATNTLPSGWSRIKGGSPQPGDILVYTGNTYGHVAIYEASNAIWHQNWGYSYVIKTTNKSYNSLSTKLTYWGYIRPNFSGTPSVSHTRNTSYGTNFAATANEKIDVFNADHSDPGNYYIDKGDQCTIHEVYTDGCCYVTYPISGGTRTYYAPISKFTINGNNPIGSVDSVWGGEGFVHVSGWAFDADSKSTALNIHVYIGDEGHGWIMADKERVDVNNVHGCGNYHGFGEDIKTSKTGSQSVEIYAINVGGGGNVLLHKTTVNITPVPKYDFDVNMMIDNTAYMSGSSGFTFDLYLNGALVSNDKSDYCTPIEKGTKWEIKDIKCPSGYKFTGGTTSGTITGANDIRLTFSKSSGVLDLNGLLDGTEYGSLSDYGTADIYINGTLYANKADFCETLPAGTKYEIKNIKASTGRSYNGVHSGALSGTITGGTTQKIILSFSKIGYNLYFDVNHDNIKPNLYKPTKSTKTINGVTYQYDTTRDIIKLNGSLTASDGIIDSYKFKPEANSYYKVTAKVLSGTFSSSILVVEARNASGGTVGSRIYFDIYGTSSKTWYFSSADAASTTNLQTWLYCSNANTAKINNAEIQIKIEKVASSSASGTEFSPSMKGMHYNEAYPSTMTPTRSGYTFDGWYTAATGGTKITSSSKYPASNQTLYAHWTCTHSTTETRNAKSATCSATGYTGDTYCKTCGAKTKTGSTISKKAHSYTSTITTQPTCTKEGVKTYKCSCGASYTEAIAKKSHSIVTIPAVSATCTKTGLTEGKKCSVCGTVTVTQQTVAKIACADNNGDGKCDNCGANLGTNTPTTPDEPENKPCSCNCHKGGISGFFFKIINFFQKLFGMNKVCACGVKH